MTNGIFAGSFDPFTVGHLYIVQVASGLFDKLIICIATNPLKKQRVFEKEGMKKAIEETLKKEQITNCEVICYEGEIVELAKQVKAKYVVRGMRSEGDFEYEKQIATEYYKGGLETIYAPPRSYVETIDLSKVSSTLVRDRLQEKQSISEYVPGPIEEFIVKNKIEGKIQNCI